MMQQFLQIWVERWRSLFEIILLSVGIYYGYLYFKGTRGAKVLTGLAIVFLTLTLISQLLNLVVIGWIVRSFSVFLAVALVVIFQPELRRGLAELADIRSFPSQVRSAKRYTTSPKRLLSWRTSNSGRSSPLSGIRRFVFMKKPASSSIRSSRPSFF